MKKIGFILALITLFIGQQGFEFPAGKPTQLFDGTTFNGWEGDTLKTWKIENRAIIEIGRAHV